MNGQFENDNHSSENNFQSIYQRRINELEQKVNKYCSQYDALMNLLPIGNNFSSVFAFQKDTENINVKIETLDEKIKNINKEEVQIDKNNWNNAFSEMKIIISDNHTEIQKIKKIELKQSSKYQDVYFQDKASKRINNYEQQVTNKLAQYKNEVQSQIHKQARNNCSSISQVIRQKTYKCLAPLHQQLDNLLEQIEICRLKVPLRDLTKFHNFNHRRLLSEIIVVNDKLEDLFEKINGNDTNQQKTHLSYIDTVSHQIKNIYFQAVANKQKCLIDLLIRPLQQIGSSNQSEKMKKHITDSFNEIEQNLKEVNKRFTFFKKCINLI